MVQLLQSSGMRLPKWLWRTVRSKRFHRFIAIAPFVLMVVIVGGVWISNLIGRRAVEAMDRELSEAGVPESFADYLNPGIQPSDDLFRHPAMLDDVATKGLNRHGITSGLPGAARRAPKTSIDFAKPMSMEAWFDPPPSGGDREAVQTLLSHLEEKITHLNKLEEAFARADSGWGLIPGESEKGDTPNSISALFRLRDIADFASLVALCHLSCGQVEEALGKVELMMDAEAHTLESNPTGVSILIAKSIMMKLKDTIWEGVVRQAWSDAALVALDEGLARLRPEVAVVEAQWGELASQRSTMLKELGERRERRSQEWLEGWDSGKENTVMRLRGLAWNYGPRGRWDYANARTAEIFLNEGWRDQGRPRTRFSVEDLLRFQSLAQPGTGLRFEWKGGSMTMPSPMRQAHAFLGRAVSTSLLIETDIALLRVGIAIERSRRSAAGIPDRLEDLVPDFLARVPVDPWSGAALNYRKRQDGTPLLWSVGPDRIDEGGLPCRDRMEGDVVWITSPLPGLTDKVYGR